MSGGFSRLRHVKFCSVGLVSHERCLTLFFARLTMVIVRFALSGEAASGTMIRVVQLFGYWRGEGHLRNGPALVLLACKLVDVTFVVKPCDKTAVVQLSVVWQCATYYCC